jgi:anionic cell wall polymer biosynthesis LytR-Cps2A-Psr (LCP) family protein
MKKKKSGSIAIPFLLTFLISLIIIGGIAMIIYDKIDSESSSLLTMTNEAGTLSDSDSHTILFVLDLSDSIDDSEDEEEEEDTDEESSEDEETYDWEETGDDEEKEVKAEPYTFMIMRSMPVHKQIVFIGLPDNMLAGQQNKSLTEIYESGGGADVKAAAEFSLEIPIDRYMVFDSESFQKLCNIMGGVNFAVPGNIEGFKKSDGLQYLSPDQIEKIVSYGGFGGGEIQRISTAASLITAMTNQTSGARIADNLDNTFEVMVNATDTDISALDYQQEKYAVKFLMKYSDPNDDETVSDRAKFITPSGTQTSDKFILDTSFIDDIAQYFVVETTSPQQEETLQPMIPETEAQNDAE